MKFYRRIVTVSAGAVLALSAIMSAGFAPLASAASTVTWTGGGTDGNWSTTANWAGGVAPVSGDSVVIDNSANFSHGSTDDIASLSLAGLTFTNNASSGTPIISLGTGLTITGNITQGSGDTTTADKIVSSSTAETITLGANVTVTTTGGLTIGNAGDTLALGSNTLTFTDGGGSTANITAIAANITGTGSLVFNGPATDYQLEGTNTYSGTTHVVATNLPISTTGSSSSFGTSAITVETGGAISFDYSSNTTISNAITIAGTSSGSPVTSLDFQSTGSGTTLTVPNITLNGETRFANGNPSSDPLTINLAGITTNGYCVEYLGYGSDSGNISGTANGFQNGPTACVVSGSSGTGSTSSTPKAPDTGFALVSSNPLATAGVVILLAGAILGLGLRSRKLASKR